MRMTEKEWRKLCEIEKEKGKISKTPYLAVNIRCIRRGKHVIQFFFIHKMT